MILLLFKPYKVYFLLISKMDNVAVRKKEQCPGVPVGPLFIKTSLNPNDYVIGLVSPFLEVENQSWLINLGSTMRVAITYLSLFQVFLNPKSTIKKCSIRNTDFVWCLPNEVMRSDAGHCSRTTKKDRDQMKVDDREEEYTPPLV